MAHFPILPLLMGIMLSVPALADTNEYGTITEFPLAWPDPAKGSTHEIIFGKNEQAFWITGQTHDHVARLSLDGSAVFHPMPKGSGPHGVSFDRDGQLWVSLEFSGLVVRLNDQGEITQEIDVHIYAEGSPKPINSNPHAIAFGPDGETMWFTGKKTSTIGKINPDGSVEHFELPTIGAAPIYLTPGPDGNMWCTELLGNNIARITPNGVVTEFAIPTYNSRPIAIIPGPDGRSLWFSEEAGHKVARIDMQGNIVEFSVPSTQKNVIMAGLAFDSEGNLWTHSYVDPNNPLPAGPDQIVKMDKSINTAAAADISRIPITYYQVPTRKTIMHRIVEGPDGNIWFTELGADKVGRLFTGKKKYATKVAPRLR